MDKMEGEKNDINVFGVLLEKKAKHKCVNKRAETEITVGKCGCKKNVVLKCRIECTKRANTVQE